MFNDIKYSIDLNNYSVKTITKIKDLFKESGIYEYIYEREDYDNYLKSEIYNYYIIQFLSNVKENYKRISLEGINSNESWIIDKIRLLAKLKAEKEDLKFVTEGIIENIYLSDVNDNDIFYKRLIKLFNEYSIYYDIFTKAVVTYSNPYDFVKDFTNLVQLYYNFVKEQIQKNTLKTGSSNILYILACADIYFPLVEQEINEKFNKTKFDFEYPVDGIMIIKE